MSKDNLFLPRQLSFTSHTLNAEFGPPQWKSSKLPTVQRPEWFDNSWHNDVCPSFDLIDKPDKEGYGPTLRIWVDEARPDKREIPGSSAYMLTWNPEGVGAPSHTLFETNSLEEFNMLLAALKL